ncbi:MAG: elongation factor Ts [Alphaproteobacteria bacterium]|nr:MAG: elongation factor Ts [Alphaproteobacteria bacterium]
MTITASMVKELREMTGAGMMDCKNALNETKGDMAAAVDWLRAKGIAKAEKKSGRVAAEGLIGIAASGNRAAVVEVNSETDFVARNDQFQELVRRIAQTALATDGAVASVAAAPIAGGAKSVTDTLTDAIATIGENMTLRRAAVMSVGNGVVASYVHNAAGEGLGKIGVLVALESTGAAGPLAAIGRQVAMHVAATNPLAATRADVPAEIAERERAIFAEQARESGKPDNIIEKMVDGRMRKFFEENVLLSQVFVIDGENTVEQALKNAEKEVGAPIGLKGFVRMALGEGIDKGDSGDFAAEVAALARG